MLIGLTGTYCAGKNFVAGLLEQRGLSVLDVDKLGHEAIEQQKAVIFSRFGEALKKNDGTVDRRRLGEMVFGRAGELAALEAIVHPAANRLIEEWIAARAGQNCVINAALLHRCSVFKRLDCIILVCAPFVTRLLRARRRDGISWFALLRRFASQKNFTAQYLAGNADIYKVKNLGFLGRPGSLPAAWYFLAKLERRLDTLLEGKI